MPDDVARALGASGSLTVTIAGRECTVRPLGIRELTEVERDCVERYKRSYLSTFAKNLDLVPEQSRDRMLEQKMEAAARWDVDDLPSKFAHDPAKVRMNQDLKDWISAHYPVEPTTAAPRLMRMAATALDQESLTAEDYRRMTGEEPPRVKVPYVNWWITASYEGMITFIWMCFRGNGVTREQVIDELGSNPAMLVELSREIERLSAPSVGNG